MFSFKSDSKDGVIIAKAEGPDIDCNISYFECDTKKPPTHVIDSYDACKILRDQYDSQFFHKNGKHKSSNEELLPIPGHIQVYGKNHLVLSPERVENQRHCIFLAGAPGSGKSYWVNDYAIRWQTLFPDGKIIVISRKSKEDEDNFKFTYQQSGVDEQTDPIGLADVKNYQAKNDTQFKTPFLFIYDDVMTYPTVIRKKILASMADVVCVGRSFAVDVILCSQKLNDAQNTAMIHANCTHYVFFPASHKQIIEDSLLKRMKLKKQVVDYLLDRPTRTLIISCCYPQFVLTQNTIWPLNLLSELKKKK